MAREIWFWTFGVLAGVIVMSLPSSWNMVTICIAAGAVGIVSVLIAYQISRRE